MSTQTVKLGLLGKVLMLLIGLNIVGDIGNIVIWYASPDSRGSLNGGLIAANSGAEAALTAGTIVLSLISVIYIVNLYGLMKNTKWAPLLVIAISVANRALAVVLYEISIAFLFWVVWTIILVALSALIYRKMKT
jgi:hypothetical protein